MSTKKISLYAALICSSSVLLMPAIIKADGGGGIVPCDGGPSNPCTISAFFTMLANIYKFIVVYIASPLAVIAIIIGGILMMISAGNPNMMGKGKKIFFTAIIGLLLVFCSYLIINWVVTAAGGPGNWSNPTSGS